MTSLKALENTPRAYSYARFSTPEQAKGDSLRRQNEGARAWALKHGVELDTELNLTDKGISAYAGANVETGALGVFLEAVKEGVVPKGSWLLVESLDRISRQTAWDASYTMQGIVRAGVTVVDLSDGAREYNTETLSADPMALLVMVMMFSRANNESATKAMRVASAFENKRRKLASNEPLTKPYTKRLPAWIQWDDEGKAYKLIDDRAALLRQIFKLTDEGWGQHRIAHWLNETNVDTWGAGGWKARYWHRSYIRKLLSNKAAVGTFIPHRMKPKAGGNARERTPLEPIHHRYPAAIDRELFERVASRLETTAPRGRNTAAPARSIFAGVIKCKHCLGTVTRIAKGKHVYLVCSTANARGGTCRYETVPYHEAEDALCMNIEHTVEQAPRGRDTAETQEAIEMQQIELDAANDRVQELLQVVIADKSRAARAKLQEVEHQRENIREALRKLRERRDTLTSTNVTARLSAVANALATTPLDIVKANKALKEAVRMMILKPEEGLIEIHWHHAEDPQEITLVTRRKRWDSPFELADTTTLTAEGGHGDI